MKDKIELWVNSHEDELVEDVIKIVEIESVSEDYTEESGYGEGCTKVLNKMLELGEKYGFDTKNYDKRCGSISANVQEENRKTIGMWGHLDVVPASGEWRYPPYKPTLESGFILGRGVQDNKGPSIAVLYAMRCLKELNIPLNYNLKQFVGCSEEREMSDVIHYVKNYPVPDFSMVTDCAFPVCYGEKGILDVVLSSKPLDDKTLILKGGTVSNLVPDNAKAEWSVAGEVKSIIAKGISAHTAFPQGGENAILNLCNEFLDKVELSESDKIAVSFVKSVCSCYNGETLEIDMVDEEFGELTCAGSIINTKDNVLSLTCNIRYCPSKTGDEILQSIERVAGQFGFSITHSHDSAPSYFDKNSPIVKKLTDVYNEVTGNDGKPFVMGGGTYARKIPNAVTFGPGIYIDSSVLNLPEGHGGCHTPDEAQSVQGLLTAVKVYAITLIELNDFFK